MKLSISIFAHYLKHYHPTLILKNNDFENDSFDIETVRLFTSGQDYKNHILYIGYAHEIDESYTSGIICKHKEHYIYLPANDIHTILNDILSVMETFSAWNTALLQLLSADAMPQDLFDASLHLFSRPVFLLDHSQKLLAYTSNFGPDDVNEQWHDMLTKGSSDLDYLVKINEAYPERFSRTSIFYSQPSIYPDRLYEKNFFFRNQWIGIAALIDKYGDLSAGEIAIFSLFCNYLSDWFSKHIEEQSKLLTDSQLHMVISDPSYDCEPFIRQLLLNGWRKEDELCFIKLDNISNAFTINHHLCYTLTLKYPELYVISYDVSICILCNTTKVSLEQLKKELQILLTHSQYYGTVSKCFTLTENIFEQYQSLSLSSNYCPKVPGTLYYGPNYAFAYLMSTVSQHIHKDLCHDTLKKLKNYDEIHHTDFYNTLYHYLRCERSPQTTAKEMNIHRNTLAYRLKRLEELISDDLEQPEIRFHLLLSYEIEKAVQE